MRIKEFGENLVGISFGNGEVSFLTYRENIKIIRERIIKKESFSIRSLTGKDIVFIINDNLRCYIVSDSHTGDTVSIYFDD
ncbi:MAG: hypothetical protein DSY47_02655 [Hydrogenothermus sp.]|nr:MAG: hypothetical protein DSY47_02655 [Hydrogenothermus sp.]